MTRLYMVRHGKAEAGFDVADPGLDPAGLAQAENAAKKLAPLGPLRIWTSPLKRAQETAKPLARAWKCEPSICEAVAEIPTPEGLSPKTRVPWLREFMGGTWRGADAKLVAWRDDVIRTLTSIASDTVIFSHFIAINVGVGHVISDDRVVLFAPDNCSVTIFEVDGKTLKLIERGDEAVTRVV